MTGLPTPDLTPSPRQRLAAMLSVEGTAPFPLDRATLSRLVTRIDAVPLFIHAYTFHFHLLDEVWGPGDLLDFAAAHGLAGVQCHVFDAGRRSLAAMAPADRRALGARARDLGLRWHVEVSSTTPEDLGAALAVAADLGAESIRCYPRYAGRVSGILERVAADLLWVLDRLGPKGRFRLVVEQHEDLTSEEMVRIVKTCADPRVGLLFDTGNMVNAGERPMEALRIQAPWVRAVHLKDVLMLPDRGGWAQFGCRTGTGDVPLARMLADLLVLGEETPQVTAIGLEEEVNYVAPAYRFPGEPPDPVIPPREPSLTARLPGLSDAMSRQIEHRDALAQLQWVRTMFAEMRALASAIIEGQE
ncbi:sugar phosphate isomerase/epimerase family protein [Rhodospira trueperi]|uniref:Sugar phosphate isomerase/epimerase n=1 Tax=Rhodospira trueperi TaxID=69960 RepID=A0A1G7ALN4_9PROT|nr:TIM barrel protein [Rhodospira trueperi]SDE15844.1 Sugar phosphate isomerase/epimerase [Rhodospira trueperi]